MDPNKDVIMQDSSSSIEDSQQAFTEYRQQSLTDDRNPKKQRTAGLASPPTNSLRNWEIQLTPHQMAIRHHMNKPSNQTNRVTKDFPYTTITKKEKQA
ncbi:1477_t:CDS:2 [Gigaspora margarita]|uniref:1477_t:CDS:1 n=1 Tax=Gigaspora margarita TaxID=4874 RepID=A0ABN7VR68_GIGMA|nr:1477_t:CDS:2 [Gigaspora margarita]